MQENTQPQQPDNGIRKPIFTSTGQGNPANKLLDGGDDPIKTYITATNFEDINSVNDTCRNIAQCDEFGLPKDMIRTKILAQGAVGGMQAHWFVRCVIGVIELGAEKTKGAVNSVKGLFKAKEAA
mgnify:CR=1 FL=1